MVPASTPPPAERSELEATLAIAREAGRSTLEWFRSSTLEVERKDDGTPVTAADRRAERIVRDRLAGIFDGDGVLGEEEPPVTSRTGRRWIVDPIDGTKAFTCGVPLYATLLALEDEHGIALGVIDIPALGEAVWAGRGLGAWTDTGPARVQPGTALEGAFVTSSAVSGWTGEQLEAIGAAGVHLRTWGDGYGYMLVATGRVAAMVDPAAAPYDVAPMPVILSEAGGRFTDLAGRERIDGGSGLASNGELHDALLALLAPC